MITNKTLNKKYYIFFDIDGTLISYDGTLSTSTIFALKQVQKKGHKIFIATGRAKQIIPQNVLDIGFDGIISASGMHLEYNNKLIYEIAFKPNQVKKTINILNNNQLKFIMATHKECVANSVGYLTLANYYTNYKYKFKTIKEAKNSKSKILQSLEPVLIDKDVNNYYKKYLNVKSFVYHSKNITIEYIANLLGTEYKVQNLSQSKTDDFSGEIMLACCSKSNAIAKLSEILQFSIDNTIAFGDGANDYDMIKFANIGVAMQCAPDIIKKQATFTTENVENNGIYNALNKLQLL